MNHGWLQGAINSMRPTVILVFFSTLGASGLVADSYKVQLQKLAPPSAAAPEIRDVLNEQAFRIDDTQGRAFAEIWLRRSIPGSEKPSEPRGTIQFPFLADGELIGLVQFGVEGHDYRDQPIAKGVYTMRYGLQPVNGDHLGVSPYRDYFLLLPAGKDKSLAPPPRKQLEERSAESAGTSHPAVFLLLQAPSEAARSGPAIIHDEDKSTWSVVLPLTLQIKGQTDPVVHPVAMVIVGSAPA
jgi:hypothetical protein